MKKKGFTLIEIMIAVAIIGLLATIATPSFSRAAKRAKEVACLKNRAAVEDIEALFVFEEGRHTNGLEELVNFGYLRKLPSCPSGGTWSWGNYLETDSRYKTTLECSIHGLVLSVTGSAKTTLDASQATSYYGGRWGWFKDGGDLYTYWSGRWAKYKFDFEEGAGTYNLSIEAKNQVGSGWSGVDGYENFRVAIYVDDTYKGTALIPASDATYNTGSLPIEVSDRGYHDVKLVWTNDKYNPGAFQDANIRLRSVSIQKQE